MPARTAVAIKGAARVSVTVEVVLDQPWGPEATVGEMHSSATREALEKLSALLGRSGVRVVGEPRVALITFEEQR